ncbi:MAG: HAMP domain-containing sensor histidine kinase [Thermoleophilia bacterium]
MTLRVRLGATAGVAVALVAVALVAAAYALTRTELRSQVDDALLQRARQVQGPPGFARPRLQQPPPPAFGGAPGAFQLVAPDGTVTRPASADAPLPVDDRTRAIAASGRGRAFSDVTVDGVHLRVLAAGLPGRGAVQVARPLGEVDDALDRLLLLLGGLGLIGIVLAALLGLLVARTALAPVARFTRRTEAIVVDPDLSHRLEVEGSDELARLAASFNRALDALERSVEAQRHLVQDASHELRTPLASLRANVQLLDRAHELPPGDRAALHDDLVAELDQLTALVADIVELARGERGQAEHDDVRVDLVVEAAVERAARRAADAVSFSTGLEPTTVTGDPERIGRAVANLLDNAVKWSPSGGTIEVSLVGGELTVRDHGPGFATDDLAHVFDRFYRARTARSTPGSGLGLAIVRQAAEAHGGSASAENAPGGGALVRVRFGPVVAA